MIGFEIGAAISTERVVSQIMTVDSLQLRGLLMYGIAHVTCHSHWRVWNTPVEWDAERPLSVSLSLCLSLSLSLSLSMFIYICKGKAVPLQAWSGPEGSRNLRLPDFVTGWW